MLLLLAPGAGLTGAPRQECKSVAPEMADSALVTGYNYVQLFRDNNQCDYYSKLCTVGQIVSETNM